VNGGLIMHGPYVVIVPENSPECFFKAGYKFTAWDYDLLRN